MAIPSRILSLKPKAWADVGLASREVNGLMSDPVTMKPIVH